MREFIHFEDRDSDHPFIEKVWRCYSDRADRFFSLAENTFEIVVSHLGSRKFITLRGPETFAMPVDCPSDGEWTCIRFKPGTFMRLFAPGVLRDRNEVTLPHASDRAFWFNGSAIEYPDFENAEAFVERLFREDALERDGVVIDVLKRRPHELSVRTAQRRFLRSTGVTYTTYRQIERARRAVELLREGIPALDVVAYAGYFDQAHLARSLRRFIGDTPTSIARREAQLSFLYKTDASLHGTLPSVTAS